MRSEKVPSSKSEASLEKLYFDTFVQMVRDSVGTNMFRHMWVRRKFRQKPIDVLDDGYNSCAYYVSSVLKIFGKIGDFHATVANTVRDLKSSGWVEVEEPEVGDVLVWEAVLADDGWHKHLGFYVDDGLAISNSWDERVPIEHDLHFGKDQRAVELILRLPSWTSN